MASRTKLLLYCPERKEGRKEAGLRENLRAGKAKNTAEPPNYTPNPRSLHLAHL